MNSFIKEQAEGIREIGDDIQVDIFDLHTERSRLNYLMKSKELVSTVAMGGYDIVHYHYGLSALPAFMKEPKAKQVVTFHGSDVYDLHHRVISKRVNKICDYSIFVNEEQVSILKPKNDMYEIIPCGIKSSIFKKMDRREFRNKMGFAENKKYILFPGSKDNKVKNFSLLEDAYKLLDNRLFEIVELKGYERDDVPLLMNACDVVVMTSLHEGSPQVLKEAAFCQRPIVTVNVGDVSTILKGSNNSFIIDNREPIKIANSIEIACKKEFNYGFENIELYDNSEISRRVYNVYEKLICHSN